MAESDINFNAHVLHIYSQVCYYVYNHLVRHDLDEMTKWHNDHRIRRQKNPGIVSGKPLVLFRMPEEYGE